MPIRFDQIFKDITESSYFDNPIYVSFLILFIIFLIIYFNFASMCQDKDKFWLILFRSAFYSIFPIMLILFMHYKHLESEYDKKIENKSVNEAVVASTEGNKEKISNILKEI